MNSERSDEDRSHDPESLSEEESHKIESLLNLSSPRWPIKGHLGLLFNPLCS
jgi:hypothetical protein